jgi:hypothetical protein
LKNTYYTDECMWKKRIIESNLRKGCKIPQRRKREIEGHIRIWFNKF